MALAAPVEELQPVAARNIIEHLRRGSVPVAQVPCFTVGRERWLSIIEDDLAHYIGAGGTKVRFLNGDYGDGKTHFLSVIQHLVHQAGFAVSFVVLTREVPMHKFELVYREIVSRLSTAAGTTGLRGLLTHWLESLQPHLGEVPDEATRSARLEALADTLRSMDGIDLNFANGLIALLHNRFRPYREGETPEAREAERLTLYEWFEGGRLSRSELRQWQIFESLSKTNSKRLLVSLILLLRHLDYHGLIILFDELETVLLQSASVRNAAYENVRLLIDNAEQGHHLHVFFSIIPDVLLSDRGFKSYDALWSRVRSVGESRRLNYRSIVIDLHRTPLEIPELLALGQRLRRIHELAYRWDAEAIVTDAFIEQVCQTQQRMGLLPEVRLFIKQIVRYLDMAEQDSTLEGLDLTDQIIATQKEIVQEKTAQPPAWDA